MLRKFLLLAVLIPVSAAMAAQKGAPPPDPTQEPLMVKAGFLDWHPDLRFRLRGLEEIKEKKYEDALKSFRYAAFFADKPSQGMVAEMYWNGQGAPKDPALAYAWMDLAAERGYVGFLGLRERYWNELDASQRERALQEGQLLYARYGDAAAKPRIAWKLRQGRARTTGSRTGSAGNLQIILPGPGDSNRSIQGTKFYDERYWDPSQYQQWHDSIWSKPKVGRVDVGEIEQVKSRVPATQPENDAPEPEAPVD